MSDRNNDPIRNGGFSEGRDAPRAWTWSEEGAQASWRFAEGLIEGAGRSIRIETNSPGASGSFAQRFRCRSGQWYRFEALVGARQVDDRPGGRFELRIEQRNLRGQAIGSLRRLGPCRCPAPVVWREYWLSEEGARTAELGVYWAGGSGAGCVGLVRCVPVGESEAAGHPLAIPPPPTAYPPPLAAESVEVVGDDVPEMLVEALRACFGAGTVTQVPATTCDPASVSADAVIIYQNPPAKTVPSWNTLLRLAASKVVVVCPPLFARLAGRAAKGRIAVRTLRQWDDPLFVKVRDANFVTRGFALLDVFPYARFRAATGAFELRCLKRTRALKDFVSKEGILTALVSEAATDATTDLPVCLVRPTDAGAVVVLDLSAFDSSPCTEDALNLVSFVLLNALGQRQVTVGQFVRPQMKSPALAREIRDLVERFPPLRFEGDHPAPSAGEPPPLVLEAPARSYGLAPTEKPTILIRTRLDEADWAGCCGAMLWLKQLLRPPPWPAPHLAAWLSEYRFVWTVARAEPSRQDATSAALAIDLSTGPDHVCRVFVPDQPRPYYLRLARHLPLLDRQMRRGGPTVFCPADGADPADRAAYRWTKGLPGLEVVADPAACGASGTGDHVRVRLPRYFDDSGTNSIWQTERAVLLLEWLIGLHHGLLAVNRESDPRAVRLPEFVRDGEHVVLTVDGVPRRPAASADGNGRLGAVRLEPGECLFVRSPAAAPIPRPAGLRPSHLPAGRRASPGP